MSITDIKHGEIPLQNKLVYCGHKIFAHYGHKSSVHYMSVIDKRFMSVMDKFVSKMNFVMFYVRNGQKLYVRT